jgi:hypothetical protein
MTFVAKKIVGQKEFVFPPPRLVLLLDPGLIKIRIRDKYPGSATMLPRITVIGVIRQDLSWSSLVLRIRIRMFLGPLDPDPSEPLFSAPLGPDPLVRVTDPDPSIFKQK